MRYAPRVISSSDVPGNVFFVDGRDWGGVVKGGFGRECSGGTALPALVRDVT